MSKDLKFMMTLDLDGKAFLKGVKKADDGLEKLGDTANDVGNALDTLRQKAQKNGSTVESLAGSYLNASGRLVDAKGRFISTSQAVDKSTSSFFGFNKIVGGTGRSIFTMMKQMTSLPNMLAGVGGALSLFSISGIADEMQNLDSQIKLVTESQQQFLAVRQQIDVIANTHRTNIASVTQLYTNSARALANLGKTQQETLNFTNAVSLAMAVGGKSALEQSSAILQLGQAMQAGVLNGDEFRSIAENAPIMLDLVAQSLGKTRGEIKKLASESKITADVVYNALAGSTQQLESMFATMPMTMSQAMQTTTNKFKRYMGDMLNTTTGVSSLIASAIVTVGDNLDNIANVALAGAVLGFGVLASSINISQLAMVAFNTVFRANPILLVASAVLAVVTATGELSTMLQFAGAVGVDFFNLLKIGFSGINDLALAVYNNITGASAESNKQSAGFFGGFFAGTGKGFMGFARGVARVFDAIGGFTTGLAIFIGRKFAQVVTGAGNMFAKLANTIKSVFAMAVNGAISAVNFGTAKINTMIRGANVIAEAVGLGGLKEIPKLQNMTVQRSVIVKAPKVSFDQSINDGFKSQGGAIENYFAGVGERIADKLKKATTIKGAGLDRKLVGLAGAKNSMDNNAKKAKGAASKAKKAKVPKVRTAKAPKIKKAKIKKTKQPRVKKAKAPRQQKDHAQDFAKFIAQQKQTQSNYDFETSLIGKQAEEVERLRFAHQITQKAKEAGKGLSQAVIQQETQALIEQQNVYIKIRQQAEATKQIKDFASSENKGLTDYTFETSLIGKQSDEIDRLRFAHDLMNKAKEMSKGYSEQAKEQLQQQTDKILAQREALVTLRAQQQELTNNDWVAGINNGINSIFANAKTLNQTMSDITTGTFNKMSDGIATFVATGKGNFKELTRSILQDISKMLIKFAMLKIAKMAMGMFADGGVFDSSGVTAFAKGGAFNNQSIQYYAKGDIFDKPTAFRHAGGLGVMGEAGAEAVMPLTRGADGKLGVKVHGAKQQQNTGSVVNQVAIDIHMTSDSTSANVQTSSQDSKKMAEQLKAVVIQVLSEQQRSGGMLAR